MLQAVGARRTLPLLLFCLLIVGAQGATRYRTERAFSLPMGLAAWLSLIALVRCHSSRGAGNKRAPPLLQNWSRENNVAGAVRLLAAIAELTDDVQQLMVLGLKLAPTPDGEVVGILLHFADGSVKQP
jgi:hypothetical protein